VLRFLYRFVVLHVVLIGGRLVHPLAFIPKKSSGFTLIELAIVIAIVAVLAAVAIPRFLSMTGSANIAKLHDLESRLRSAEAQFVAKTQKLPQNMDQFVTTNATVNPNVVNPNTATPEFETLTIVDLHDGTGVPCQLNPNEIRCAGWKEISADAVFTLTNTGQLTSNLDTVVATP
jgi:prepilin-type N-terminal cleavage/methylation domain-containing protein